MAALGHPNVVAVHDAGTHGDEVFVAMELVSGTDLKRWLERSHSLAETLEVLLQAGRGLAHAHMAKLVHRDFKPANVLVSESGQVKVGDFGLARAAVSSAAVTDLAPSILDSTRTQTESVSGTPAYMAPEVQAGQPATERSDQYSYCVTAWEALHGSRPRFGDAKPSSERVLDEPARCGCPPGLHAVLARGLHPDPARRFENMEGLLAALEHAAAPKGRSRRNVGLAGVVGVGGIGLWLAFSSTSADCGRSAELDGIWNAGVRMELRETFERAGGSAGGEAFSRVAPRLDLQVEQWQQASAQACRADLSEEERRAEAACRRRRLDGLAHVVEVLRGGEIDVVEHAVSIVSALPDSEACRVVDVGMDPTQMASARELRRTLDRVAVFERAARWGEVESLAHAAATQAESDGLSLLRAEALIVLGRAQRMQGELESALSSARDASRIASEGHSDRLAAEAWIETMWTLSLDSKRLDAASAMADVAAASLRRLDDVGDLDAQLFEAQSAVAYRLGEFERALEAGEQAASRYRELGRELDESRVMEDLSLAYHHLGKFDEAHRIQTEALTVIGAELGTGHPLYATGLVNLGAIEADQGRRDDAAAHSEQALEILEGMYGPAHLRVATVLRNLAVSAMRAGEFELALTRNGRALAIFEATYGELHEDVALSHHNAAAIHLMARDFERARVEARQALRIRRELFGAHPETAFTLVMLGDLERILGDLDQARAFAEEALAMQRELLPPEHPDLAVAHGTLAELALEQGDTEAALRHARRGLEIAEVVHEDELKIARHILSVGDALLASHQATDAIELAERALSLGRVQEHPRWRSRATLLIAQALMEPGGDRRRALELVQGARRALIEDGADAESDLLRRADALLDRLPVEAR